MTMRLDNEPSYILHSRSFKETSLIIEVLTKYQGRVSLLVKGAKRPKSKARGLLSPFFPLLISGIGRGELLTATNVESGGLAIRFNHQALLSGLYLNELLFKGLPKYDPIGVLFEHYEQTLKHLAQHQGIKAQIGLRHFEYELLKALGYGFNFDHDVSHQAIEPEQCYDFNPEQGFIQVRQDESPLRGKVLLRLADSQFELEDMNALKWLMRKALASILNGKTLHSRELVRGIGEV